VCVVKCSRCSYIFLCCVYTLSDFPDGEENRGPDDNEGGGDDYGWPEGNDYESGDEDEDGEEYRGPDDNEDGDEDEDEDDEDEEGEDEGGNRGGCAHCYDAYCDDGPYESNSFLAYQKRSIEECDANGCQHIRDQCE